MRILFLGDIVGRAGRRAVVDHLPRLRRRFGLDFIIVNGENASGGFGIGEKDALSLFAAGADVITTGNHVWDQRETMTYIAREHRLLRPANLPPGAPGKGTGLFASANGRQILVINLMGRVFMQGMDCPFQTIEKELEACRLGQDVDAIFVDMHAEASSEKQAMGHFLDGRVSAVIGTHTHVPTADERILPGGSAFMTDAGMCGIFDSVLGMEKEEPVNRFLTGMRAGRFAAEKKGEAAICGACVETDDATGLARKIASLRLGPDISVSEPVFWAHGSQA
jgi:metallophosphoesterase (TIGR00282 family)